MTAHFVDLLDQLRRRALRMASLVQDMLEEACDAALSANAGLAERVIGRDNDVDAEEVEVETEVIRLLALYQPVGSDLRTLCTVLKINNDLERIADCAVNMAERASHLGSDYDPRELKDLQHMSVIVQASLRTAIRAYADSDANVARDVRRGDDAIDATYGQIIRRIIHQVGDTPGRVASHLDILSIAKNLERIADHATNIAEDVIYQCTGQIVRHRGFGDGI
jgi:phosphate transport system protein